MKHLIIALLLIISFNGFAQMDTTKVQEIDEVVISAQYTPQREKNAIYKVKVISAEEIARKSANNLRELLQQELNIDLSQGSVFGTSVEMQGLSKENIKILIDGVPVIGRLNGVIDLNQINLNNIDHIEIIEGPVSVFYGTDATGGIINLITKKTQDKKFEGKVYGYYEDIQAMRLGVNFGYRFGKNTIKIGGGNYRFYGYSTIDSLRSKNWAPRNQYFANLLVNHNFGKVKMVFKSDFSNEELTTQGDPDRHGKIKDIDYFTRRIDNSLNFRGNVFGKKYINATFSFLDYQRYHNAYNINPETWEGTLSETDNKEHSVVTFNYAGVQAQLGTNDSSKKLNYALGLDINTEATTGERILDNKKRIDTYALLGSLNYKIKQKIELQPSARVTINSAYGSLISPAFNAKVKINENNQVRFSYGRGFRAPSLKELYLDFHINAGPFTYFISGNEDLEVEKSHSFDLRYTFTHSLRKNQSIAINPSVYYNEVTNLITLSDMIDSKRHYINIDQFRSVGGKIDVNYTISKALQLKTGFNYYGRYSDLKEDYIEKLLYTPEISAGVQYEIPKIKTLLDIYYKYTGERSGYTEGDTADEIVRTTRESYNNLDISLSRNFYNDTFQVALGVKNVFDVKDVETTNETGEAHARNMQLWGRTFFVRASYNF